MEDNNSSHDQSGRLIDVQATVTRSKCREYEGFDGGGTRIVIVVLHCHQNVPDGVKDEVYIGRDGLGDYHCGAKYKSKDGVVTIGQRGFVVERRDSFKHQEQINENCAFCGDVACEFLKSVVLNWLLEKLVVDVMGIVGGYGEGLQQVLIEASSHERQRVTWGCYGRGRSVGFGENKLFNRVIEELE